MSAPKPMRVVTYNFEEHMWDVANVAHLYMAEVTIVEGIVTFHGKKMRDMMHLKVLLDEDPDIDMSPCIERDTSSRGRGVEAILAQYVRFEKPSFEKFMLPTKGYTDMTMPRVSENVVLTDMIINHGAW